jgi:hypothetical protein
MNMIDPTTAPARTRRDAPAQSSDLGVEAR